MSTMTDPSAKRDEFVPLPGSFAEFHARLGGVPLDRIWMKPPPGTATESDLLASERRRGRRWCELVDGTLVEKFGTFLGAVLVGELIGRLGNWVHEYDGGVLLNGLCPIRLKPGLIRRPSLSYTPWDHFPGVELPGEEIGSYPPVFVAELANRWNTVPELERKAHEYVAAGAKLVWVIDTQTRTAKIYTSTKRAKELDSAGTLDGGKVLPGFKLPLTELFAATKRRKKPRS